jgi:hypothetical protein
LFSSGLDGVLPKAFFASALYDLYAFLFFVSYLLGPFLFLFALVLGLAITFRKEVPTERKGKIWAILLITFLATAYSLRH